MAGSDPFDVADVQWRPVSPKLATVRRIVLGITCLVAALPPLVVAIGDWSVAATVTDLVVATLFLVPSLMLKLMVRVAIFGVAALSV